MKPLTPKQLTARRHELFDAFSKAALKCLVDDEVAACRLADTALKALSGPETDAPVAGDSGSTEGVSRFTADLLRAYAPDPIPPDDASGGDAASASP